ncbi:MAG: hypothetical protein N3G76_01795 [Candidatus Micrarchaeota archaeon]|nr:hypothetical protein [Candidatus Micrarchaeota archaeon]
MQKRKVAYKAERKSFLGMWKKIDDHELMGIREERIKEIETLLAESKSIHEIFGYVKKNLPGWSISYLYKEGKHHVTIEKEDSKQRIVFEIEPVK